MSLTVSATFVLCGRSKLSVSNQKGTHEILITSITLYVVCRKIMFSVMSFCLSFCSQGNRGSSCDPHNHTGRYPPGPVQTCSPGEPPSPHLFKLGDPLDQFQLVHLGNPHPQDLFKLVHYETTRPIQTCSLGKPAPPPPTFWKVGGWPLTERPSY